MVLACRRALVGWSCVTLTLLVGVGCGRRSPRDHHLISVVIVDQVRALPDSAKPGEYAGLGATTPDSNQRILEATWVGWWYTAHSNDVELPPDIVGRFSRHFDTRHPPPDPFPEVPDEYSVSNVLAQQDTLLTAVIGPSFARCTYTFAYRDQQWVLLPDRVTNCSIS
jgi:hypothetical protein